MSQSDAVESLAWTDDSPRWPLEMVRRAWQGRARGDVPVQLFAAGGLVVLIAALCFFLPMTGVVDNPNLSYTTGAQAIFSPGHLLGTDDLGRDVLARALYGGRVSFGVGFGAVGLGLIIGGTLGLVAGYVHGWVDVIISRILDTLLAFPALVLALAVAAYLGPSERDELLAIAFFTIPGYGRYTRAAVLRLSEEDFLKANIALGARRIYSVVRHVVPNIMGTLLTFGFLTVSAAMLAEAGLSFLGAGIRPPQPSWGNMIVEGQPFLQLAPHILVVPGIFLFVTILGMNMFADALRRRYRL